MWVLGLVRDSTLGFVCTCNVPMYAPLFQVPMSDFLKEGFRTQGLLIRALLKKPEQDAKCLRAEDCLQAW